MTNIYVKLIDCHQCLDYSFSNPNYIKRSKVYTHSLGARRLCLPESPFFKHYSKIKL